MTEIWKEVKGYEGFYEVSNLGNVRSMAVYSYKYKQVLRRKTPRMRVQETTKDGYKRVLLCLYGKHKKWAVHRLVAQAFIPNDKGLPCVNHKDENTANNRAENLEWCDWSYNSNYGTLPKRISERLSIHHPTAKVVNQYDVDGTFIAAYPSLKAASRKLGTVSADMIGRACAGKAKTAAGFKWSFA